MKGEFINMKYFFCLILIVTLCCVQVYAQITTADSIVNTLKSNLKISEDTLFIITENDSSYYVIKSPENSDQKIVVLRKHKDSKEFFRVPYHINCSLDSLPDGVHVTTFTNGHLESAFYIEKNQENGYCYEYYNRNKLYLICEYKDGLESGRKIFYSRKGTNHYLWINNFVDGVYDGYQYEFFTRSGYLSSMKLFNNGILQAQSRYFKSGKMFYEESKNDGVYVDAQCYRKNGELRWKKFFYSNGKSYKTEFYRRNGKLKNTTYE